MKLIVHPCSEPLRGRCRPPGDKSVSHRLAILGALAQGETTISGYLESADTLATLAAMEQLGAGVRRAGGEVRIDGGLGSVRQATLDLGNSGTGVRLLAGALAGRRELSGAELTLIGDHSLSSRPMGRIIEPLRQMGAELSCEDDRLPIRLKPSPLHGIRYRPRVASAQVKSAVLLAGLAAEGETVLVEPGPSRDHTERLLPAFGAGIARDGAELRIIGGQTLRGGAFRVPGDLSSAAFLIGAAVLVPGSNVSIENVGINPTRDGVLRILKAMQVDLDQRPGQSVGEEPVGTLQVNGSSLKGLAIPREWVPLAIDEFPLIMALAAVAEGSTTIVGAEELRVKESDRLAVMCEQLIRLGVKLKETPDGAVIRGGPVHGGTVDSCGDHRIAMSLAVLGLVASSPVVIRNAEWIQTSYPRFPEDLQSLGANVEWREEEA